MRPWLRQRHTCTQRGAPNVTAASLLRSSATGVAAAAAAVEPPVLQQQRLRATPLSVKMFAHQQSIFVDTPRNTRGHWAACKVVKVLTGVAAGTAAAAAAVVTAAPAVGTQYAYVCVHIAKRAASSAPRARSVLTREQKVYLEYGTACADCLRSLECVTVQRPLLCVHLQNTARRALAAITLVPARSTLAPAAALRTLHPHHC
jgi:hypothetical protein